MTWRLASATLIASFLAMAGPAGQQSAPPDEFVPGEVIVRYRPALSAAVRDGIVARRVARMVRRFEAIGTDHVRLPPGLSVAAAIAAFRQDDGVVSVQPNYFRRTAASPPSNDPRWLDDSLWGLQRIQVQPVWSAWTTGSADVVIAGIDSGVNYNHPDLAANMWRNPGEIPGNGVDDDGNGYVDDVFGIDTVNHDSNPMDDHGHGTHTAGTMAAVGNNGVGVSGVNWNAKILACKFLNSAGNGTDVGAIECFNYVVGMKQRGVNIRVSNNSWGAPRGTGPLPMALKQAIDAAGEAGIVNVFAAGNEVANLEVTPFDPASLTSPSIVAVAASDGADNLAGFSNYGQASVDLAAPGVAIVSTYGTGYNALSGTSMAAPHVAGAAALLVAREPALTVASIKSLLMASVDRMPQWSPLTVSSGRLNVFRAMVSVGDAEPPTVTNLLPTEGSVVSGLVPITVAASDNVGVLGVQFQVDGVNVSYEDQGAPYGAVWDSFGVSNGLHVVTATARDGAGHSASASVTVTVSNSGGPPPQGLLTSQVPAVQAYDDHVNYELGLRFRSDVAGQILAVRFWKAVGEAGPHVGTVWSATGQALATVTFANETASGWQVQALASPLAIAAETDYVVSVPTGPNQRYVGTSNLFATPLVNGHLRTGAGAPSRYGPAGAFPASSSVHGYFRDVLFVAGGGPTDTTPPTVTNLLPAEGSVVSWLVPLSVTATDNVGVLGVQFAVDGVPVGAEDLVAPYGATWDSTLVGNGPHTVTATARDAAGLTGAASVTVHVSNGLPAQTLLTSQVPAVQTYDDHINYELGVRFRSDVAGQVTGVRFWKAPGETGPHVGTVWSATGQVLATVTFANETASGWQVQALASPLAIAAETDYIVSVPTGPNQRYVGTGNLFATPLVNGHLRTGAGAPSRYGPAGVFPTSGSLHGYFRDVLFVPDGGGAPDTTPPVVTNLLPAEGSVVSGLVPLSVTATDNVGVLGVQFAIDGASVGPEDLVAPYGVPWDSTLVGNGLHTVRATARDAAGFTASVSVTVTVSNPAGTPPQTLLTAQVPAVQTFDDHINYELGVRFRSAVAGQITGVRFWKAIGETGPHVGTVWSATGQVLATVTFANETASGWQVQALASPLAIAAETDYIVSVPTGPNQRYVGTGNLFATPLVNGHLRTGAGAPSRYGPAGAFPTSSSLHGYFRDVLFVADGSGATDTTPPVVTNLLPAEGSVVSGVVPLSVTATDNVGVAGVQFQVDGAPVGGVDATVPYSVAWDSALVANGPHTVTALAWDGVGLSSEISVTVTVNNPAGTPPQTLLTSQVPAVQTFDDHINYELGVRFRSAVAGQITGVRFWKAPGETGPHVGTVWSATGQVLATVTFANETASGWQVQALASPLAIAAETDYIVSVPTGPNQRYVGTGNLFATPLVNGHLRTGAGAPGRYGPAGAFPASSSLHGYFRDVLFVPEN